MEKLFSILKTIPPMIINEI